MARPDQARKIHALCAALLAVALSACGGSGSPTAPPPPDPPQTINGNVTAFGFSQHSLTASRAGLMRITLTWSNAAIDLDMYLTNSACDGYPPLRCTSLATSATASGTSESITRQVDAGEQLKVWVDNFDPTLASGYTIQVTIQ